MFIPKSSFLHVKIAGGATAQCLGLMNALYASNKLNIPFKISYYPYSTGTYWPFAIKMLLTESEILNCSKPTKGLKISNDLKVGKIITSHPLMTKKFSYERLLSFIRRLNLEHVLQFLRRELAIRNSPDRLININSYFKVISGGFAAINEKNVNKEMHYRFNRANKKSPFVKEVTQEKLIIIHYRLGDKRAVGRHPSDFNSDLVIDPQSYADILNRIHKIESENIYVVSDDPNLAKELLAGVKINAKIKSSAGDIWEDLHFMSQADVFIGGISQVSQLANICVEINGGKSFMLDVSSHDNYLKFENTTYFKSKYLDSTHKIYELDFVLDENSHSAYEKPI